MKELKLKKPNYKNEIELFIEGDENDGDYTSETNFLSEKDFKEMLPILKKLQKHGTIVEINDKPTITEEELEVVQDFFPTPVNDGGEIHTIAHIKAWFLSKKDSIRYEISI